MASSQTSEQKNAEQGDESTCCPQEKHLGETACKIADTFQNMVMVRGFNAVSYGDLAKELGIRTASIHYHFPAKAELGATVLTRYRDNFKNTWEDIDVGDPNSYVLAYESFMAPIRPVRDMEGVSCLFGVLGATHETLCPNIQGILANFFIEQEVWLAKVFKGGRDEGVFHFQGTATSFAKLYASALQGAMLIKKSTNNPKHFDAVIDQLESMLFG
jgi:TetR/AcrR family transcriptional regulator, transcriptional repressor for nem operon